MLELVEFIVDKLVGSEGQHSVALIEKGSEVDITVTCEKKVIGKIIGKQGRIAKAIRAIVKAAGAKEDTRRYNVVIQEMD
ncbi:MAG TPA: KH domain-containing protein [Eubacteriales bacterium]|jgi:predicted RNA-binding protein YlqC (UPF0109 family)|nr:KH domain-containing protein [Clostridia bacterium]HRR90566.1 KH domain-containing protein [Eubacteriales bacterium]HRU84005.1 KH domain-containing protein [Eubacteriales bacterium]